MADFQVGDRVRWPKDGCAAVWLLVVETNDLKGETRTHHWPAGTRVLPTDELVLVQRAHYAPPGVTLVPLANNVLDVLAEAMKRADNFQGIHHEVIDDIVRHIGLAEFYASAAFDAGEARGAALVAMTAERIEALVDAADALDYQHLKRAADCDTPREDDVNIPGGCMCKKHEDAVRAMLAEAKP